MRRGSMGTRIWASLIADGPATADKVADKFGLTHAKAKSHLTLLTCRGRTNAVKQPTVYEANLDVGQ